MSKDIFGDIMHKGFSHVILRQKNSDFVNKGMKTIIPDTEFKLLHIVKRCFIKIFLQKSEASSITKKHRMNKLYLSFPFSLKRYSHLECSFECKI